MPETDSFGAFGSGGGVEAPAPPSTPPSPTSGQPAAPAADEPKYQVTVAGQQMEVPLSELLKGYSRTSDYTRKTQLLAQERQQWNERESQYQQVLKEAQGILSNREILEQHLRSMGATPTQAREQAQEALPSGDEVLTRGQLQQLLAEEKKKWRDEVLAEQQGGFQELQVKQLASEYRTSLDQKLDEIATRHPDLPKIPGMDFVIKQAVQQQKPKNLEQALLLMDEAADFFATQISEVWKAKAAPSSAPTVRGIEPPRGQPPLPPPQNEVYDSVTDPRLRDSVIADLEKLIRR